MNLPAALEQQPDISTWIQLVAGRIVIRTGKVELGQGISTAIAIIAAEELDVDVNRLQVITGTTESGPNEFITAGSMSIEGSGMAVRQACAELRQHLLATAAARFEVPVSSLTIEDGIARHAGRNESLSYEDLLPDLNLRATGEAQPKSPASYRLVGTTATRVDLLKKLTGRPAYVQDIRPRGVCHGRVVRPPTEAHRLQSVPTDLALPDSVQFVTNGSWLGLCGPDEFDVVKAKQILEQRAEWTVDPALELPGDIVTSLLNFDRVSLPVIEGTPVEAPVPTRRTRNLAMTARYTKPYHLHGSIGPSAALAEFDGQVLRIRSHSQGPTLIRGAIASVLNMAPENIIVEHAENAGCYGHNGADDAAFDAALLAMAQPGKPVLLKWQREDEHRYEPYSPAMVLDMAASMDEGKISYWSADVYSQTHSGRPLPHRSISNLLSAWQISEPVRRPEPRPGMGNHSGIHRNADPLYTFPERRIIKHLVNDQRVRTSSTRGLGAFGNVFAIESFMDELAHAAGADPFEFRLAHLDDARSAVVLETLKAHVAKLHHDSPPGKVVGTGIAFAQYKNRQTRAGVAMQLSVDEETFEIALLHAVIVADAGQVIDRDGVSNQLEGGLIQAASWTLKEAVPFGDYGTRALNWDAYPILTFPEIPTVEVVLLDHPDLPPVGAGEATQGPTPAAIANAIFDATGLRLRDIPLTPDKLKEAALAS